MTYDRKWLIQSYKDSIRRETELVKNWERLIRKSHFEAEEMHLVRKQISKHKEFIANAERQISALRFEVP